MAYDQRPYLKRWGRSLKGRFSQLRRAAKDKSLGFDITLEQHAELLSRACFYCGGPLNPTGHALDRKDNSVGYVLSNVVSCCYACNKIKNVFLSHEEMIVAMAAVLELRRSNS